VLPFDEATQHGNSSNHHNSKQLNRPNPVSPSQQRLWKIIWIIPILLLLLLFYWFLFVIQQRQQQLLRVQPTHLQQQQQQQHTHKYTQLDQQRRVFLHNALLKIKARNAYLCPLNTDHSQWRRKTGGPKRFQEIKEMYQHPQVLMLALQPLYPCPWTLHRTNIVSETTPVAKFDGGKWTCGVSEMKGRRPVPVPVRAHRFNNNNNKINIIKPISTCVVYSFGSNGDDFFEADVLQQNSNCEIHIFDPTMTHSPHSWKDIPHYHFHRSGLCAAARSGGTGNNSTTTSSGDHDTTTSFVLKGTGTRNADGTFIDDISFPCKTLRAHMHDLGHRRVDIVKADVEGMEWSLTREWGRRRVATTTTDSTHKKAEADAGTTTTTGGTTTGVPLSSMVGQLLMEFHFWHGEAPHDLSTLLRQHIIPLERLGFFLHTTEPVGATIDAYEVTFLNVNWRPEYEYEYDDEYEYDEYSTDDPTNNSTTVGGDHDNANGSGGRMRGRRSPTSRNKVPLLYDPSMYPQTPNVVL